MLFVQVSAENGLNEESAEDEVASLHRAARMVVIGGQIVDLLIGWGIEHQDAEEHPHIIQAEFQFILTVCFRIHLDFFERHKLQVL